MYFLCILAEDMEEEDEGAIEEARQERLRMAQEAASSSNRAEEDFTFPGAGHACMTVHEDAWGKRRGERLTLPGACMRREGGVAMNMGRAWEGGSRFSDEDSGVGGQRRPAGSGGRGIGQGTVESKG